MGKVTGNGFLDWAGLVVVKTTVLRMGLASGDLVAF